jgi:hypothetical protein
MSKKFTFNKLADKTFKNGLTRENYQIGLTDKTALMTPEDVKYIVDGLTAKAPKGTKFVVQGLGIAGVHELGDSSKYVHRQMKGFYGDLKFLSEEEYFEGKSRETAKFLQYFQIMISIVRPRNKKK